MNGMGIRRLGNNYFIDYYANGRRIRKVIPGASKSLAERILKKRQIEVVENKHLDIRKEKKISFEELAEKYMDTYSRPRKRSWRSDERSIRLLSKYFGGKNLHEITQFDIEQFQAKRKTPKISAATVNREIACLKGMFSKAIDWGMALDNPSKKVKLLAENNCRMRFLEKEEIRILLGECKGYLRPIVTTALHTGMRKGEILGLKWRDIDFHRDIIYLYATKNGEKREIPMNKIVKAEIIAVRKNPDSQYIFCNKSGTPFGDIRKSFASALEESHIKDFKFHDLRHTFASHLVMGGVDLNTVRELLGHKSLQMTLRYAHLAPDHKKRAVDVLTQQIGNIWANPVREEKGSLPEVVIA